MRMNAEQLREVLHDERDRLDAARAQLEIATEELATLEAELAIANAELAATRDDAAALRRELGASRLERDLVETRIVAALAGSPTTAFGQDLALRYVWAIGLPQHHGRERVEGLLDADVFPRDEAERLSAIKHEVLRSLRPIRRSLALTIGAQVRRVDVFVKPAFDDEGALAGVCGVATELPPDRA